MRLAFHIFFVLLLLQDVLSISDDFSGSTSFYFLNSNKQNDKGNCSGAQCISNGLFNYVSYVFDKIFSKKLIKQAKQEIVDFKDDEKKKMKRQLSKVLRSESDKIKKKTDQQFKYWDKLLEKSASEQIHKIDKFSKDQIDLMKQKGEYLLSSNIFNFYKNKEENEKQEMETENKQETTEGRRFWPFTASSYNSNEEKKEEPLKEEQDSFLHFFKFGKKEDGTEKKEPLEVEQNKSEQHIFSPWWFSKTKEEQIMNNDFKNSVETKQKNMSNKGFFSGLFSSEAKSEEDDSETEKTKEEKPLQKKWHHIFTSDKTEEVPDVSEASALEKNEYEQSSWWSRTFGKNAGKKNETNQNMNEELQESEEHGKQTERWWNFKKIFPSNDVQMETEKDDDIQQSKHRENELKENKENESMFHMWGYGNHQETDMLGEEKVVKEVNGNSEDINKLNDHEETQKTWVNSIFDMPSHENTHEEKLNEHEETKAKEVEAESEAEKGKNKMEEVVDTKVEDEPKEGISSLFHFNDSKQPENKNIEEQEEIAPISDSYPRLNFIEKIYNFNLDDVQDEQFISLLTERHEAEPNVNCHPLIAFKLCLHKCFKSLMPDENSTESTDAGVTQNVGSSQVGLNTNDYKQLEKCILKCKKVSFDSVHGGCIQANGKVLNKKENFKEYLDELEAYNLHLTNNPTAFSDFSLEDKYAERIITQKEKPLQKNVIQNRLLQKNKASNFASGVWDTGKKELNLKMFNKNNESMSTAFQSSVGKTDKANGYTSIVRNSASLASTTENNDNNKKQLFGASMNLFNPFKNRKTTNTETEQDEQVGSFVQEEKIEFLNHDTYTIPDDKLENEIYTISNSFMSTVFFLILIILAVFIYFSVFTSIISQFFSACIEEVTSFIRDSYKSSFVGMPNTPTEHFIPKNEKQNVPCATHYLDNSIRDNVYVSANEINPLMDADAVNTKRYPVYSYPPDQV